MCKLNKITLYLKDFLILISLILHLRVYFKIIYKVKFISMSFAKNMQVYNSIKRYIRINLIR